MVKTRILIVDDELSIIKLPRAKLEPEPTNPAYIMTVPGVGYQFKAAA